MIRRMLVRGAQDRPRIRHDATDPPRQPPSEGPWAEDLARGPRFRMSPVDAEDARRSEVISARACDRHRGEELTRVLAKPWRDASSRRTVRATCELKLECSERPSTMFRVEK